MNDDFHGLIEQATADLIETVGGFIDSGVEG